MPTITFKATEMKDAKVAHISLVDRAATRIPFKVIKQEKPMSVFKHLDLASVFKREPVVETPVVIGVITMKSEDAAEFDSLKAQLVEMGFSVDKPTEFDDNSVIFAQGDSVVTKGEEEPTLIRLSDTAVLAVKGFRPYSMDMTMGDGGSFADLCKSQGFYPGVGTVVDVLRSSIFTSTEKSDTPDAAATQVSKMFDEAKSYTVAMIKGLPTTAFKLESACDEAVVVKIEGEEIPEEELALYDQVLKDSAASAKAWASRRKNTSSNQRAAHRQLLHLAGLSRANKTDEEIAAEAAAAEVVAKAAATTEAPATTVTTEAVDKGCKPKEGSADGDEDDAAAAAAAKLKAKKEDGTDPDPVLTIEAVTEVVQKQISEFAAKMETLFGGVSGTIEKLGESVTTLATRVETAEGVAKAAKEAVQGTVVLGGDGGDHVEVVKSEQVNRGREIDTAYMPRQSRNAGRR